MARTTRFPALEWYRKLASGEISVEEWSELTEDDLKHITTYDEEPGEDNGTDNS